MGFLSVSHPVFFHSLTSFFYFFFFALAFLDSFHSTRHLLGSMMSKLKNVQGGAKRKPKKEERGRGREGKEREEKRREGGCPLEYRPTKKKVASNKSCIVRIFYFRYDPTIEDSYCKHIEVDGQDYTLELTDTAGQSEYRDQWDDQFMR